MCADVTLDTSLLPFVTYWAFWLYILCLYKLMCHCGVWYLFRFPTAVFPLLTLQRGAPPSQTLCRHRKKKKNQHKTRLQKHNVPQSSNPEVGKKIFPEAHTDLEKVSKGPQIEPFIIENWEVFEQTFVVWAQYANRHQKKACSVLQTCMTARSTLWLLILGRSTTF